MVGLGLVAWGGQAGVVFGLTYNAQDTREGALGVGWRHSYEARLAPSANGVALHEPDGRIVEFAEQPDGSYVAMKGVYDRLQRKPDGSFELIRASQIRWMFDPSGRLMAIRDLHNQGVSLEYNPAGQLSRVVDTTGRALVLAYYGQNAPLAWQGRLRAVWMENDPFQREWRFEYLPTLNEPGTMVVRLNKVIFPRLYYDADGDGVLEEDDPKTHAYLFSYTNFGDEWAPRYLLTQIDNREQLGVVYRYDIANSGRLECTGYTVLGPPISGGGGRDFSRAAVCAIPIRDCAIIDPSGECAGGLGGSSNRRVHYGVSQDEHGNWSFLTYEYDALGRLMRTIDPLGRTTTFAWNLLYQLQSVTSPAGATYSFCWDERGNLTRAADPQGNAVEMEYTALNRLRSVRDALTPAGKYRAFYGYNAANELEQVKQSNAPEVTYVREALTGRLKEVAYGNGTKVVYTYEPAPPAGNPDRVKAMEWKAGANAFRKEVYHRDELGRIQRKEEFLPDAQGSLQKVAEVVYTYDHQGQLISEQRTGQHAYSVSYTYDKVGNRLTRTRTVNNQTTVDTMTYNEANQLTSLNGQTWVHDADGNVIVRRANGETWQLGYDSEGNLVHLKRQGANVGWVYTYDGLGRRVRAQLGGNTLQFLYGAGDAVLAERASGGAWTVLSFGYNLYAVGNEYYHWDYLGTRVGSINNPPLIYDAFGDYVSGVSPVYGWHGDYGHRREVETGGLIWVGIRWYDPVVGRFLQPDPAYASPVYQYCWNDPVQLVDCGGWKPGDKYNSPDAAAKAAIRDIWEQSQNAGIEYGGWIYGTEDGKFSYTPPVSGTDLSVTLPDQTQVLKPGQFPVGGYHTHVITPNVDKNWVEHFSDKDRRWAKFYCMPLYLDTPSGVIKKLVWDSDAKLFHETAIGRVR